MFKDSGFLDKEITSLFRYYFWIGSVLVGYLLVASVLPPAYHGWIVACDGLIDLFFALFLVFHPKPRPEPWRVALVAGIFLFWGISEITWAISYYLLKESSRNPTIALLTEFGYLASFGCIFFLILINLRKARRNLLQWKTAWIPIVISFPVFFGILISPLTLNKGLSFFSIFNLIEIFAIVLELTLVNLSLFILLVSSQMGWSIFSAGVVCLVFGDAGMRVNKIIGYSPHFDIFSALALLGLFTIALAWHLDQVNDCISIERKPSLFVDYKFGTILIALVCLLFFSVSSRDLQALKTICLGSSLGALFSVLLSSFITAKIKHFTLCLGEIVKKDVVSRNSKGDDLLVKNLPLELQDHYGFILSSLQREQFLRDKERKAAEDLILLKTLIHNIQGPVQVIKAKVGDVRFSAVSSQPMLMRCINRVADQLLQASSQFQTVQKKQEAEKVLVISLLEDVVSEMRTRFSERADLSIDLKVEGGSHSNFVEVNLIEFHSLVTNLVTNSVQAIEESGHIVVRLKEQDGYCRIFIIDNGKGIPSHIVSRLGEEGFSYGKPQGSGLGIYHAKNWTSKWSGSFSISSRIGEGTEVCIRLPKADPPSWFPDKLVVSDQEEVVILDDDPAIHEFWNHRFKEVGGIDVRVKNLYSVQDFEEFIEKTDSNDKTFLVDYEIFDRARNVFNQMNGIDLVKKFGIQTKSILVTSHFHEPHIRMLCEEYKIKLLPKFLMPLLPIRPNISPAKRPYDSILIDNDECIRWYWEDVAAASKVTLKTFHSVSDFLRDSALFHKETKIYLDYELGDDINGEEQSRLLFYKHGFTNIVLQTAYHPKNLRIVPWIKEIRSKNPPWQEEHRG